MKLSLQDTVSQLLHPENLVTLNGIRRGIERETLRVTPNAGLATTSHPEVFGSPLTHTWITTDFAEAMMEFITSADTDANKSVEMLTDIHRHVYQNLGEELLWPLSMPCKIGDDIALANYGSSSTGMLKTKYRLGLKHRYGSSMQIISGLHYNFSMPDNFWPVLQKIESDRNPLKTFISESYFGLIRNFLRFGWLISYLFGASPVVDSTFFKHSSSKLSLSPLGPNSFYLPHATSLRMSALGYASEIQNELSISYNSLATFVRDLRHATGQNGKTLERTDQKKHGEQQQIITETLQEESELYAPIRPKRTIKTGEKLSQALQERGVQYVEVRSLDINPYTATGINLEQVRFLDVFLTYCLLKSSPQMSAEDLSTIKQNQQKVATNGREQSLELMDNTHPKTLVSWASEIFLEMKGVAELLDKNSPGSGHQIALDSQTGKLNDPSKTPSARIIHDIVEKEVDLSELAMALAHNHRQALLKEGYTQLHKSDFSLEAVKSRMKQREMEYRDSTGCNNFLTPKSDLPYTSTHLAEGS